MKYPLIISIKSTELINSEKKNLNIYKPFGVILFSRNILNFNQVRRLIKSIKSQSKHTLILIDQEGGIVNRFQKFPEFKFLDNYDYYKIYLKYPSLAKQLVYLKSFITSYHLKELGFDINTIPVLDLPIKNTVAMIQKRTFGPNVDTSIILNEVLLSASNLFGIIPVMKHIPGHGVTNKDSHFALPVSKLSIKKLNRHLKLFKQFNHLPLVMTAHIKYLSWDKNNIATFSSKIINQIIKSDVKFKGLIMSDDLMMKANIYNITQIISLSNRSGIDILLDCSSNWDRYIEIIKNFEISNNYKSKKNLLSNGLKLSKFNIKSININHYYHLYNELLKLYGI